MNKKSEAEILDELCAVRDGVTDRIVGLLMGSNNEDDNIHQIVGSALLEAYVRGRDDGSPVIIENMDDIRRAIEEKVLEVYGGNTGAV